MDIHMWVEDKKGNVVCDPWFKEYDYIKRVRNCEPGAEEMYHAYTGEKGRKWMARIQKDMKEKLSIFDLDAGIVTQWGSSKKQVWAEFYDNPKFQMCTFNAISYWKKNKHLVLRVGAMGWRTRTGKIWWEFGMGPNMASDRGTAWSPTRR